MRRERGSMEVLNGSVEESRNRRRVPIPDRYRNGFCQPSSGDVVVGTRASTSIAVVLVVPACSATAARTGTSCAGAVAIAGVSRITVTLMTPGILHLRLDLSGDLGE